MIICRKGLYSKCEIYDECLQVCMHCAILSAVRKQKKKTYEASLAVEFGGLSFVFPPGSPPRNKNLQRLEFVDEVEQSTPFELAEIGAVVKRGGDEPSVAVHGHELQP